MPRGYNAVTDSWAPAPNITYSIVQNGSNWELTQPDDSVLTFNAAGELTSIKYRGGYTQTLTWTNGQNTQVSDNLGRSLSFTYGANGRLAEMTDPDGRKIKYSYLQRAGFDSVVHYDLAKGTRRAHRVGPQDGVGEPVFVPRTPDAAEGDGFLLALVYRGAEQRSELLILDAQDVEAAPLARVRLPHRVPFGFHGNWAQGV